MRQDEMNQAQWDNPDNWVGPDWAATRDLSSANCDSFSKI